MKAGLRLGMMAFATGLWLGAPAFAQSLPQNTTQNSVQQTSTPPATNRIGTTVGPRELQNFSIGGTATRPTETSNSPATTTKPTAPTNPGFAPLQLPSRSAPAAPSGSTTRQTPAPQRRAEPRRQAQPPAETFGPLNVATQPISPSAAPPLEQPAPETAPQSESVPAPVAPPSESSLWPWLLAAIAVGAGLAILLWRRRPQRAVVEGPEEFEEPSLPVAPRPRPVAPPPPPSAEPLVRRVAAEPASAAAVPPTGPVPVGIVSTRLRPWLDVTFLPVACRIDEQRISFEFDIDVYNTGSGPARDTRIEATLFNAGANQEQAIAAFMAAPTNAAEPLGPIGPLQRVSLRMTLEASRASIEQFAVGGRQVFVPVIAFNATYHWSGGAGQTSGSALLGRETGSEKLGPLRIDLGNRAFAGLGTRPLPSAIRK